MSCSPTHLAWSPPHFAPSSSTYQGSSLVTLSVSTSLERGPTFHHSDGAQPLLCLCLLLGSLEQASQTQELEDSSLASNVGQTL